MRPRLSVLLLPIALWGCVDEPTSPLSPDVPPAEAILDAARGSGAAGFYFLTPIAPALPAYPGTFDGSLSPVVEICRWTGTACDGAPLARYSITEGTGGVLLRVVPAGEHYRVDWPVTGLPRGQLHRIRVLLDDTELGYADAQVPSVGQTAAQLVAQGIVPLGNSSRLAIRFRLEEGVGEEEPEPVTPRQAALVAVRDQVLELEGHGLTGSALNAAIVQFIASQPDFETAGLDENGTSVWGRFTDGRLLIITNNWVEPAGEPAAATGGADRERMRDLLATLDQAIVPRLAGWDAEGSAPGLHSAAARSPVALPTNREELVRFASAGPVFLPARRQSQLGELPTSSQIRLHVGIPQRTLPPNAEQEQIDGFYSVTEMMGQMLETVEYEMTGGLDGSIEALREVEGDGLFFFVGHGGGGTPVSGPDVYAIQSTSAVVFGLDDTDELYAADLDAHRVVYMLNHNGMVTPQGQPVREFFYGITDRFVSEYMDFENAMVIINTCGSASPAADEFSTAVLASGAAVYFGWSGSAITPFHSMSAVIRFLDRLIGANIDDPFREDPLQRPFDWPAVLSWMGGAGLSLDPATGAQLTPFTSPLTLPLTQLAPSIMIVNVSEEEDLLFITGLFGSNPCEALPPCADGAVTIDDVDLAVTEWHETFIIAELPRSGDAASGDVVVTVRDHPSNVRRLAQWNGSWTYAHNDLGSLSLTVTVNIAGRGDPGPIRNLPGDAPESVIGAIMDPMRSATASFQASGSLDVPQGECTMRESWSGSGTPVAEGYAEDLLAGVFNHFAEFDYMGGRAALHVRWAVPVTATFDVIGDEDCFGHHEVTALFSINNDAYGGNSLSIPIGAYNVQPTEGMSLPGGSRTFSVMGSNHIQIGNATVNVNWSTVSAVPELDAELEF